MECQPAEVTPPSPSSTSGCFVVIVFLPTATLPSGLPGVQRVEVGVDGHDHAIETLPLLAEPEDVVLTDQIFQLSNQVLCLLELLDLSVQMFVFTCHRRHPRRCP